MRCEPKGQRVLNEAQAVLPSYDLAPRPPPSASPVSKLTLFLSLPVCRRSSFLTVGGRGRARSQNHSTAISLAFYKSFNTLCCRGFKRSSYIGGDVGECIAGGVVLQKSEGRGGPSHEGGGERGGRPPHGSGGEGGGWTGVGDEGGQRAQGSTSAPCVRTSSTACTVKKG